MVTENLGNENRPIVKIGNTVHRPTHPWTPAVHELLNYLESVGFKYSPRVLGFDDEGREILSYIEGESGKEGWTKVITDNGLKNFAKLLRSYHDVIKDFKPSKELEWAYTNKSPGSGEIMCHGDFGPWNVVWDGDNPVGIVDWDLVLPAKPLHDVFYALDYATPFRDDKTTLEWHHFSEIPDRKHRIQVFMDAYGMQKQSNIVDEIVDVQRNVAKYMEQLANRGLQPQADWVANGALDDAQKQTQWILENRHLFE